MDQNEMLEKFKERYETLCALEPATAKIKLSHNQSLFLKECKKWLKSLVDDPGLFQKGKVAHNFKWTQTDDIFQGQHNDLSAQGRGVCFTRTNSLVEGTFRENIIEAGVVKILYENGEFFVGEVTRGGIKHGKGTYYYSNGDRYDGQFVDDKRIGNSRLIFHDKSEYIGQFIDDEADGHGIYTDIAGNRYMSVSESVDRSSPQYQDGGSGHFLRGRLYGKGEVHYKNGDHFIGQFKGSKRHGKGTMTYNSPISEVDSSNLGKYIGMWSNDQRNGRGFMEFLNGTTFKGTWKNDEMMYGELKGPGETLYIGYFSGQKYNGSGKIIFSRGLTIMGEFSHGELPTTGIILFEDGTRFEGMINECEIGEKGKLTYKNGNIYEGFFKNGMRNGFGTLLETTGDKYEGKWDKDFQQGEGKQFLKEKKEFYDGSFNSGKRHGFGRLINSKGQLFMGEWNNGIKVKQTNKPSSPKEIETFESKVSPAEYHRLVSNFFSEVSPSDMEVKVFQ